MNLSKIYDMALGRAMFIDKCEDLIYPLVIHVSLVVLNPSHSCRNHWKQELRSFALKMLYLKLKGRDSYESRSKALNTIVDRLDLNRADTKFGWSLVKWEREGLEASEELFNQNNDLLNQSLSRILDKIADHNLTDLLNVIQNL